MGHPSRNNIGAYVKPTLALPAFAVVVGTRTGAAIDRLSAGIMAQSCVLVAHTGAITGAPTSPTYDVKLQDSDDGSTGFADIAGAAITQKTVATAALIEKDVDLGPAKRFIRAVEVTAMTGGTTPTHPAAVEVILGGHQSLPQ